jgi:hypothetical protein
MFLFNVLRRMRARAGRNRGGSRPAQGRRSRTRPLVLEALEDRCLLSTYSFALIADNSASSPFSLAALNQPGLNDEGTVMFHSGLKSGPIGVFTVNTAGSLTTIARTDLVGASDMFLGGGITDDGTVSFGAHLAGGGGQAVFTGDGQELTRIADNGAGSPFSGFLAPAAPINNDGTVAFRATLNSGTGIFTDSAGEAPQTLYITGGQFSALLQPIIQRNGNEVSFRGTLTSTGQDGVFLGDGQTTTTIATTGVTYNGFTGGVTNDQGTVAFIANLSGGGQAVVTGDGTHLTTIADTTSGRFSGFLGNTATINNRGQVVFAASLAGSNGSGIFIAQHHHVDEIIGTSFTTNPFAPRGFNNEGQLGFAAILADGRTVIVRADPHDDAPGRTNQLYFDARPMNALQGPGPAPMPPLPIESMSQSAGPQGTSVASDPSTLPPATLGVSSSVTAPPTVLPLASVGEPILQTGNSEAVTDGLDGRLVGLAVGQDDVPGEF